MTAPDIDSDAVKAIMTEVGAYIADLFARFDPATHLLEDGREAVTIADVECEQQLATRLLQLLPGSIVIGEEDLHFRHKLGLQKPVFTAADTVWFIDPIDGTKSFKSKRDDFAMMVGLQQQGVLGHGWIYFPIKKLWIEGSLGKGAKIAGHTATLKQVDDPHAAIIMIDEHHFPSNHHADGERRRDIMAEETAVLAEAFAAFGDQHVPSYSCREIEWLLTGEADYLFHANGLVWDNAAGIAIYRAAGGIVRLLDSSDYILNDEHAVQMRRRGLLYAPNEVAFAAAQAALAPVRAYFSRQGLL